MFAGCEKLAADLGREGKLLLGRNVNRSRRGSRFCSTSLFWGCCGLFLAISHRGRAPLDGLDAVGSSWGLDVSNRLVSMTPYAVILGFSGNGAILHRVPNPTVMLHRRGVDFLAALPPDPFHPPPYGILKLRLSLQKFSGTFA